VVFGYAQAAIAVAMTWFNAIMCGWPPVCKDFGSDEQEQSLAVMCPACWRGVMAAGLDGIRGPRPEMTVLTVGPFAATALAATVASSLFRLSRHFAARIGLVPKEYSTAKSGSAGSASEATPIFVNC